MIAMENCWSIYPREYFVIDCLEQLDQTHANGVSVNFRWGRRVALKVTAKSVIGAF